VVDDEGPCLDELVYMLSSQENIDIVGAFTCPFDALDASVDLNPDLAFLDLSMPHLSGAELARELLARIPKLKVIFVTAYGKELARLKDNYSIASILKPISERKLRKVLGYFYD